MLCLVRHWPFVHDVIQWHCDERITKYLCKLTTVQILSPLSPFWSASLSISLNPLAQAISIMCGMTLSQSLCMSRSTVLPSSDYNFPGKSSKRFFRHQHWPNNYQKKVPTFTHECLFYYHNNNCMQEEFMRLNSLAMRNSRTKSHYQIRCSLHKTPWNCLDNN